VNLRGTLLVVALLAAGALAGCRAKARVDVGDAGAEEREVVVFAASSLQDAFGGISTAFRAAHPGVEVRLNFAGSQQLKTQIEHGARFDVLASADTPSALALARANHLGPLVTFAENEPVVAVAPAAAAVVRTLADLPEADRLVIGTPEVPIGRYTLELLDRASSELGEDFRARVEAKVASRELNVRQVLSKVLLGEAQAGVVYRSDTVAARGRVHVIEIPRHLNVVARYPIAVAARATHPRLARAFLDFVSSPAGHEALGTWGFRVPEGR
jgi:molybdate transport system substrate-binding protein